MEILSLLGDNTCWNHQNTHTMHKFLKTSIVLLLLSSNLPLNISDIRQWGTSKLIRVFCNVLPLPSTPFFLHPTTEIIALNNRFDCYRAILFQRYGQILSLVHRLAFARSLDNYIFSFISHHSIFILCHIPL